MNQQMHPQQSAGRSTTGWELLALWALVFIALLVLASRTPFGGLFDGDHSVGVAWRTVTELQAASQCIYSLAATC